MKKYQVSPQEKNNITISSFESKSKTLNTNDKTKALKYAKELKKQYSLVSFNVDTYENGVCVKNEFGTYTTKIIINSFVNYKKTKKEKCNYKMSDYFGADVLNKLK